jgi:hypothetical protein
MVTITVDLSYVHTSKREALSVEEALAWFASQLPEDTTLVDEEGEPDLSTLAAIAICKGCLRGKALAKDGARVAAKVAPSHVYTARLGDVNKEAATTLEAAKVEAAKLAGIDLTPSKPAKVAAPAKALEEQIAKLMAENASLAAKPAKPAKPVCECKLPGIDAGNPGVCPTCHRKHRKPAPQCPTCERVKALLPEWETDIAAAKRSGLLAMDMVDCFSDLSHALNGEVTP